MTPGPSVVRRILLVLAVAASGTASAVRAQGSGEVLQRWDLHHLRGGWCLSFMMDPERAADELPDELVPARAMVVEDVHPAILRTAETESGYSTWIPSRVCFYHFDTVTVDDRYEFTGDELADMNETQVLGIWGIAAQAAEQTGSEVVYYIPDLRSRDGSLVAVARRAYLRVDGLDLEMGLMPDSEENRYRYEIAGTTLTWDGHLAPDSSRAVEQIQHKWLVRSTRGSLVAARLSLQPVSHHYMVGILSIQGDDDLARALNESPIRMVGPMYLDGGGSLAFLR